MAADPTRKIKEGGIKLKPFTLLEVGDDPITWLMAKAVAGMLLLAHADDGVIWGKVTSSEHGIHIEFPSTNLLPQAPLRNETLIMARLFDANQEIFLWQVDEGEWCARLLQDGVGDTCEYIDEAQILWGDIKEKQQKGFARLTEGAQGLRHAPPQELLINEARVHKAHLTVRHYLHDEDGWLRVAFSRLVKPETEDKQA